MSRTDPQLKFRVPAQLRDDLEEAARDKKRSLTAEITDRLEYSLSAPRIPSDLLAQLRLAAKANNRSAETELMARLERSFDLDAIDTAADELAETPLETERREHRETLRRLEKRIAEAAKAPPPPSLMKAPVDKLLYVVLDANGQPIGWSEMMAHLEGLVQAAGGTFERVEAMMINSKNPQGMDYDKAAWVLERYRQGKFGWQDAGVRPGPPKDDE